jgi:septal ring factor EnvC (AmiA/AmiB activator)
MRRVFLPVAIGVLTAVGVCLFRLPAAAQDAAAAAAAAARDDSEERARQLAADMENLHAANQALEQRIASLEEEIRQLREAQARSASNSNVQDDLRHLAEKIEEVDRKRAEDKQAISEEIKHSTVSLEKALAAGSNAQGRPPPARVQADAGDKGYVYTVQEGDYLSAIIKAYNADFKSKGLKAISMKQVMEANPGLDLNRLHVGQKITIPKPQ